MRGWHGRRNHDELRLWCDYLTGGEQAAWIRDDAGSAASFPQQAAFIVMGDLNADIYRGETVNGVRAIGCLLQHPRLVDPMPHSAGGQADTNGRKFFGESAKYKTSHFSRLDYVLPSKNLAVKGTGVFWPAANEALAHEAETASDHRLVWIDVAITP